MAESPRGHGLNPTSQPFFPSQQRPPLSGSDGTDRQLTSSPVPVDPIHVQSADEDFRVKPLSASLVAPGSGNLSRYGSSPSPIPSNVFQEYRFNGPRSRDSFRDPLNLVNRSSSPALSSLSGFISPHLNTHSTTPRIKDVEDVGLFSPIDSGSVRDAVSPIGQSADYQFPNPISAAFHPQHEQQHRQLLQQQQQHQQQQQQQPSPRHETNSPFDHSLNALRSGTDREHSSPGESRENSLSSSIDFTFETDEGHPFTPNTDEGENLHHSQGFSLNLQSHSSASSRSLSTGYDIAQSGTTRGTTPLSQNFDDPINISYSTPNISIGNSDSNNNNNNNNNNNLNNNSNKQTLAPPSLDHQSISRASSRSFGQASDRPPSSFDSHPQNIPNFEAQAKASPFINNLLDRLLRWEYSTKEIQRELGDLSRKVNFLVERALMDSTATNDQNANRAASGSFNRGSNPVPSGPVGAPSAQEIRLINQRLDTVTTSVGQLLALQTQAHMQNTNAGFNGNGASSNQQQNGNGNAPMGLGMMNPSSNNALGNASPGNGGGNQSSNQVHVLPNRPEIGLGNPPNRGAVRGPNQRQWSMGPPDVIQRSASDAGVSNMGSLIRDKRKMSVGIMRRDSASTVDTDGLGASRDRDGGPVISKWEHLPLLPELLRSIAKYGVGPPNKIQQRALPFLLRGSDIIAQAPPTQERIAAYIIPAIHVALSNLVGKPPNRGPIVVIISTTVDQATQAQRMIRDLGGSIGVRSALGVGTGGDVVQELRLLQQSMPHILCGTPQKLHALFTSPGGLPGHEVRFLVLDEVDQLIARNLHEFVFNIVKLFPSPRTRPIGASGATTPLASPITGSQGNFSPFESVLSAVNGNGNGNSNGMGRPPSPFASSGVRRFSSALSSTSNSDSSIVGGSSNNIGSQTAIQPLSQPSGTPERQTALFSNTVPQDVLNLANAIQLREPVRVLVRRDGNVTHADTSNGARGLRQFYLYLAFTAGARTDNNSGANGGAGIIGSGRGASSAETAQAREWKLDALADLFDDIEVAQAIVHVGGLNSLEAVVYKLVSRGLEAVPLHGDMNAGTKLAALNKFRGSNTMIGRPPITRVLVVYDVQVKAPDVFQVPLVINYDLPKAVEEYAHRVAPAISSSYSRAGVVINFVTATGGDVEMLRSIECFYKIKCPEVPMSLRDVI